MLTEKSAAIISLKCIESLMPDLRENVLRWYEEASSIAAMPYIYYGFRSIEMQAHLYEEYKKGNCGLSAKPGESYHNYGAAIDWVPLRRMEDVPEYFEADWENMAAYSIGEKICEKHGLRPIREETGHLQDARFETWRDAKRAYERSLWP